MRPRTVKRIYFTVAAVTAIVVGGILAGAPAKADYTPGCVSQPWLYGLRMTTRTICDGPINGDGGWLRARAFHADSFYSALVCTGGAGTYVTYCTGGTWQPALDKRETYPVTPDTVLPDEPGHIPSGANTIT